MATFIPAQSHCCSKIQNSYQNTKTSPHTKTTCAVCQHFSELWPIQVSRSAMRQVLPASFSFPSQSGRTLVRSSNLEQTSPKHSPHYFALGQPPVSVYFHFWIPWWRCSNNVINGAAMSLVCPFQVLDNECKWIECTLLNMSPFEWYVNINTYALTLEG